LCRRQHLMQHFQLFWHQSRGQLGYACNVATRAAQAGHDPELHRIATHFKDNRNDSGCSLCGERCGSRSRGNHGHLASNQIRRHRRQSISSSLRPAVFDGHVLTFHIARFLQALTECSHHGPVPVRGGNVKEPDHRHCRLLRPRHERPCRRAADNADELPPSHSITSSAPQHEREQIGQRTKDGLAAAKVRGTTKKGNPLVLGNAKLAAANKAAAMERAKALAPEFAKLADKSAGAAARELNALGIAAPNGGAWRDVMVTHVRARLAALNG
jgi:hypothetical protein